MIIEADGKSTEGANDLILETGEAEPEVLRLTDQCGDRDVTIDGPVVCQLRFS